MDAREIIAQSFFQRDILSIEACRRYADYILSDLQEAGFAILHDSQNHGPTVERAARTADDPRGYAPCEHATGEQLCEGIAAAIRQLKEDRQ